MIEFSREELLLLCDWLRYKAGAAVKQKRIQEYKTIQAIQDKVSNELCNMYLKGEG